MVAAAWESPIWVRFHLRRRTRLATPRITPAKPSPTPNADRTSLATARISTITSQERGFLDSSCMDVHGCGILLLEAEKARRFLAPDALS
jgi:hypothetical protein